MTSKPKILTLQSYVDEMADRLQASLVVGSRDLKSWVASPQGPYIDEVRTKSLIERATPSDSRDYIEAFDLDKARTPFIMPADPELGIAGRVCVPVKKADAVAFAWLIPADQDTDALMKAVVDANLEVGLIDILESEHWGAFRPHGQREIVTVEDLLTGGVEDVVDVIAESLGIASNGEFGVVLVLGPLTAAGAADLTNLLRERVPGRNLHGPVGNDEVIIVERRIAESFAPALRERLSESATAADSVGVGVAYVAVGDHWPSQMRQDLRYAAIVSSVPFSHRPAARVDGLGHWRGYRHLPWTMETLTMLSPGVSRVAAHPNSEWLRTLEVFLDTNGDISECCRQLHVHRTSLHYRMARLRELLGDSLDTGSGRADLMAGISLLALARSEQTL